MYGQGGYASQFRPGPPAPPPPLQQPPFGLPLSFQQAPLGPPPPPVQQVPPPLIYQHNPLPGQTYFQQPRPAHIIAPMVPSYSISQPGPSYPSMISSQNAHYALQPMQQPPRMLPPPPPPLPPSHGQILYRTPPPPPPGIQHVLTPPPPPPSNFVSITPAPFVSFAHTYLGDAQMPALPPPPPPSSPPPLPPSPPPPTSPTADFPDIVPEEPSTDSKDNADALVASIHLTDSRGEADDIEEKVRLVEGEESAEFPSPPQKPVEKEVVRNIEVLCQFISKAGPDFENLARTKEAGNPHFAFLFGGEPGSAAAVGHAYFQWMKKKHQFEIVPPLKPPEMEVSSQTANLEDEDTISDIDMEDDVSPDGDKGFDDLNKVSTGEPITASTKVGDVKESLHAPQSITEQLVPKAAVSSTISCSSSSPFMQDGEDDNDSPFIEDVSPVRASPAADHAFEDNAKGYVGTPTGEFGLVKVSLAATAGKVVEIPRVFVKDGSPFRLIQGYASDDSEEDDKRENTGDISPIRVSPAAASSLIEVGSELPPDSNQPTTVDPSKEAVDYNIHQQDVKEPDNTTGKSKHSQDSAMVEGGSTDVYREAVDVFGRLIRKGADNSDSDEMHYSERRGKRGRSQSRSRSPQESRWRRRSRSPRRDVRSRSPRRSKSKSPPAYRRTNVFARRDRDQPPECFNFIRGRCIRGASCRFLHRDLQQDSSRQQQYQEYPHDAGNHDALVIENSHHDKTGVTNINVPLEGEGSLYMQGRKQPFEASTLTMNSGVLYEKDASFSVTDNGQPGLKKDLCEVAVVDQASQDVISQMQEPEHGGGMLEAAKVDPVEEDKDRPLPESSQPVETIQPKTFQNQTPETQPYLVHAPITRMHPSQSLMSQSYPNYTPTNQYSDQTLKPKEFPAPSFSTPSVNLEPSQLLPSTPQGHPRENLLPQVISHQPQLPPSHTFPSHGPHITGDYQYQRVPPPNPTWSNFPPQAPFTSTESPFMQFQQNVVPPRSAFIPQPAMQPTPTGELSRPQAVDFRTQPFHSVEPSHHPPLHLNEVRRMPLLVGNQQDQSFVREDWLPRPPMPGPQIISDSHWDHHSRHQPFLQEEVPASLRGQWNFSSPFAMHPQSQPFAGDLPPRFLQREEFPTVRDLPRQPPYAQQHPAGSNIPANLSTPGMADTSAARYPSSFPETNLPPHLSDTGLRKMPISTHYNPYASTFEQTPASLKPGSSFSGQENDGNVNRFDSSFSLGNVTVGRSVITASPPNSGRSGEPFWPRSSAYPPETSTEELPDVSKQLVRERATGDTYDPLFDSIEPSSIASKKLDFIKENPVVNAYVMNSSQKEGVAAELKSEADEFGEVATDAEVGAVENGSPQLDEKDWSPGIPIDEGNTAAGEIETVQVRSPEKSKKSKDSRSMKLFKVALADFVKEVLKPSWRQGNMSKEAFKTIVKKTVDKVSGAMPSHQIPKSQVKINQYVESSQRKLTKLVMGYVDKYVKS